MGIKNKLISQVETYKKIRQETDIFINFAAMSSKQKSGIKQPSTFTKRKVIRLSTVTENIQLENYQKIQSEIKTSNKTEKKKSKTFFFSTNLNQSTPNDYFSANKVAGNRIEKSGNRHCSCHLKAEDELIGVWFQNKNLKNSKSSKTKSDFKKKSVNLNKARRAKHMEL